MSARDSLVIRTPEGIEFALRLAGPFSRMLALAVDLAVIAMLGSVLEKILSPLRIFGGDFADAVHVVLYFAIALVYGAAAEWIWRGQTVGKRLLGLRVVDARGLRLEPAQVIVRNLLRVADALPALYFAGGLACVLNRRRQRLGDLAAGTVVVRTPRLARPDLDRLLGSKYNSLAEHRHLAARLRQRVRPEIAQLALDALVRREQLDPQARLALFAELARYFRSLVPYPPEVAEQLSDEPYVRNVVELVYSSRVTAAPAQTAAGRDLAVS
ncbi:MAG TPA: RDD family protein [Bryobacteraceae bacterium]|nr:RDD family protein [Bryobacteraceae bacterium]